MNEEPFNINLELAHAFGSTCSFKYNDAIAICDEENEEAKILFPAGKTIAKKFIERQQMEFIKFENNAESIECIHILPTHTHVATSEKIIGSNLRVVRIYNISGEQKPQTIKIFHDRDAYGVVKSIVFSYSQPQFMCCLIGDPHNKLIYIDVSRSKSLAESNFTVKDIDKISISPKNSHLICASGGNSVRLFKVEEYAFKPFDDIRKLPKNRRFLSHAWYKSKVILAVTDFCQVLLIEESRPGHYEVKQQYSNVFNQANFEKMSISAICTFSKGFILGSNTGKFCLWIRKQQGVNYDEERLQLVRKWATTEERASNVTGIAINKKEDLLAISFANNDITSIFLNQLMPQATDVTEEKESKDIFFQYLYKGFHNSPVTGMDVCLQRPLLATCSHDDSTIRIWNYKNYGCKLLRMFYFRLKQTDSKPLITLAFHPCGYYLAVGCKDKLRFFYVLNNQLRPYRQIALKGAHIVKFSHGGHLIATASQLREQSTEQIVHIYNAITLQQLKSFCVHSKKIKTLQWKQMDEQLCSISENGTLIEWRISDWKQIRKIQMPQYKYEFAKYYHSMNSIVVFATAFSKNFIHLFNCDDGKFEQIQIDMKVTTMNELTINKHSCLIFGLQNGSILALVFQNKKIKIVSFVNDHIRAVTLLNVSPCNKYLISSGLDCMIFVYHSSLLIKGQKIEDDNANSSVDDFLADVVLYPKQEILKYEQKQKEHTKVIASLQRKLQSISQQTEKKHKQKTQQLQMQKNRVIEDFKYRIQRIKQQIQTIKSKNKEVLLDLDSKNYADAQQLQKKYDQKIGFEKQKYFQLEQQIIQERILKKNRIKLLQDQKSKQIQKINQQFKNKFQQSQKIYTKSKDIVNNTANLFDDKIKYIESEQQQQLRQLQERLQYFKTQKASLEQQLHQKLAKIKNQHGEQTLQRNQKKKINQDLLYNKRKIDKQVQQAKEKLKQMKTEYQEKIQILHNKQMKINEFQKKFNDLQKKKHILSYKAAEMKKALEPKQIQIQKLKLDLMRLKKQFETSLQRKEKFVLFMQKIQKERQFLEKQANSLSSQLGKSNSNLDRIIYDIYNCLQNNKLETDTKAYSRSVLKLYHTYVQKNLKRSQIQNQKGIQEMTKQIVHLEKSLFQMNQSNKKNIIRKHDQIGKRINENAQLINNLNDIKKQNLQLTRKIKSKALEIQNLRSSKNVALAEIKKDEPFTPQQQISYIDNAKGQVDKSKLSLLDMRPRQRNSQALNQFKKKQCQLVSEIEFVKERTHKVQYFIKQIRQCIHKHNAMGKCPQEKLKVDEDLSAIF